MDLPDLKRCMASFSVMLGEQRSPLLRCDRRPTAVAVSATGLETWAVCRSCRSRVEFIQAGLEQLVLARPYGWIRGSYTFFDSAPFKAALALGGDEALRVMLRDVARDLAASP